MMENLEKKGSLFHSNKLKEYKFIYILIGLILLIGFLPKIEATNLILGQNFTISNNPDVGPECVTEPDDPKCVGNAFDFLSNDADSTTYWQSSSGHSSQPMTVYIDLDQNYTFYSVTLEMYGGASSWWTKCNISGSSTVNTSLTTYLPFHTLNQNNNYTFNFTEPVTLSWLRIQGGPWDQEYLIINEIYLNVSSGGNNLTLQPRDPYLNTSLNIFNATINGTQYNSTSGAVTTKIPYGNEENFSINFTAPNFLKQVVRNYNVSANFSGATYSKNMTFYKSRHAITSFKAPLNTTAINNFQIEAGGISFNTTTGSVVVNTTWNTSTRLDFNTSDYQITNWTTTGTSNDGHIFNVFQKNTFDFNILNELSWNTLDFRGWTQNNASIELISGVYSNNYTTDNGSLIISLLTPAEYTIRFKDLNGLYYERTNIATITSQSYKNMDLYMLNKTYSKSINVTATVITNLNEKLEDARISVTKYNRAANSYKTVEKTDTNFEGQAALHLTTDEFYIFQIEYGGNVVLTTTPTYVYEDDLTFVVDLGEDPTSTIFQIEDISGTLTFSSTTNLFTFTFNDPRTLSSNTCLKIYRINSSVGDTLFNSSCLTTSSGTINLGIKEINGTTYLAKGTVTLGGKEYILVTKYWGFVEDAGFGKLGIFIIILLTATFALISVWNPFVAVLLTPVPLIMGAALNIITIPVAVIAGVIVGFGFIALYIGGKS